MFTSNRNGFRPPKHPGPCLQLFVMDDVNDAADAERNVQQIGYLNVAMALHPTVLTDGRVMFSTLEGQGLRTDIEWGLWSIRPDGTEWRPLLSAFRPGGGAPMRFTFKRNSPTAGSSPRSITTKTTAASARITSFRCSPPTRPMATRWAQPIRTIREIRRCGPGASTMAGRRRRGSRSAPRASNR